MVKTNLQNGNSYINKNFKLLMPALLLLLISFCVFLPLCKNAHITVIVSFILSGIVNLRRKTVPGTR